MAIEHNHLPDGRVLSWNRYGHGERVLIHCHGSHHSGVEAAILAPETLQNWTILSPDRPGHGHSDPAPGQSLLEWARDVWVLLRREGISRPYVTGWSAGGPHALALAATGEVAGLGILSCLAPMDRPSATKGMRPTSRFGTHFARRLPRLARGAARAVTPLFRKTPGFIMWLSSSMQPAADRRYLRSRIRRVALAASRGAYRQGGAGVADDVARFLSPWAFDVADLKTPAIFWVGAKDKITPPAMTQYLANRMPRAHYRKIPSAGHFLLYGYLDALLVSMTESWAREATESGDARVSAKTRHIRVTRPKIEG